jgi:hypothetical protein
VRAWILMVGGAALAAGAGFAGVAAGRTLRGDMDQRRDRRRASAARLAPARPPPDLGNHQLCAGSRHRHLTTEYAPDLTVHHKGYVNGTAALAYLAATFPDTIEVVVAGVSAGAAATPLYAGLVSDRLPDAEITVLADGTGAAPPRRPRLQQAPRRSLGHRQRHPGLARERRPHRRAVDTISGLFIQSGRHDPDIVFARHDYAYDDVQELFASVAGVPTEDLLSEIDGNETRIEDAGVNLLSYIAPGDDHGALLYESFYTEEVNGETLVDWVTSLIEGEPVDDVHCTECTAS